MRRCSRLVSLLVVPQQTTPETGLSNRWAGMILVVAVDASRANSSMSIPGREFITRPAAGFSRTSAPAGLLVLLISIKYQVGKIIQVVHDGLFVMVILCLEFHPGCSCK